MPATIFWMTISTLQWRHNENDGVSNAGVSIVCSTVCSGADQRKHQSSAPLAFVRGPLVVSPHKRPVTQKTFFFSFDDVIMKTIFLNQDLWFEICEISCDNHSMVSCKLIFNVGLHNRPSNGLSTSHYLNQRWLNNVRRHKCASLRNDGLVKSLCISSYMHMRKFHFYVVSYNIT